jgi:hypothetical protein
MENKLIVRNGLIVRGNVSGDTALDVLGDVAGEMFIINKEIEVLPSVEFEDEDSGNSYTAVAGVITANYAFDWAAQGFVAGMVLDNIEYDDGNENDSLNEVLIISVNGAVMTLGETIDFNMTGVGYYFLFLNHNQSIKYGNIKYGYNALTGNTSGEANSAFGGFSLKSNTTGDGNIGFGYNTLTENICGNHNTAIGYEALSGNTCGNRNVGIGYCTLLKNVSGSNNLAIGYRSMSNNTTASSGVGIGYQALTCNTSGSNNTGVGIAAGFYNTTGIDNVSVGGYSQYGSFSGTDGSCNTSIGYSSLRNNTTGDDNVSVGFSSNYCNTTGRGNVGIGYKASYSNRVGSTNIAIGELSLYTATGGSNVAIGRRPLTSLYSGDANIAIGVQTLSNIVNGRCNIGIGYDAMSSVTDVCGSIAIGDQAGTNSSGNCNVFIGNYAGYNTNDSNILYIGQGTGTPLIYGDFAAQTVTIERGLIAEDVTETSDCRLKQCISPITDALSKITSLSGICYTMCSDVSQRNRIGLLAQDVDPIIPEVVTHGRAFVHDEQYGITDKKLGINYSKLTAMLIEAVKDQQKQIDSLSTELTALKESM